MSAYMTMPGGRELDGIVAEEVADRRTHWVSNGTRPGPIWADEPYDPETCAGEVPMWSTDAHEAIEELIPIIEARGFTLRFERQGPGRYRAWCDRGGEFGRTGSADTLALAICRAALAAVERKR